MHTYSNFLPDPETLKSHLINFQEELDKTNKRISSHSHSKSDYCVCGPEEALMTMTFIPGADVHRVAYSLLLFLQTLALVCEGIIYSSPNYESELKLKVKFRKIGTNLEVQITMGWRRDR
jgi:hypothetical protein